MSSTGAPNDSQQQQPQPPASHQPSTSGASLNVHVGPGGPPGAMASPHPGSSSQYPYPYGGKPLPHHVMQRPMAPPQQWPPQHGPDGGTSDGLSQPPSNYPGQQQQQQHHQGYPPPPNMYSGPPPPSSGGGGYWMGQPPQPGTQQPQRYPMHSQAQYPPGYGYPPPPPQGYMYPPPPHPMQAPMTDAWGRIQPQPPPMGYPQSSQPMPPPPMPPMQQQHAMPPPQARPPPQGGNIAAAAQALQSPSASSSHGGQDDTPEDSKSIRSTSSVPPPHTPARTPAATPSTSATPGTTKEKSTTSTPASGKNAPPPTRQEILEKLCQTQDDLPPEFMAHRRIFFDKVLSMNEQAGIPLTGPPPVSKNPVDLHKLFTKVREMGGFERVTKDKLWKNLCSVANRDMSESSAAGYQLRRHYERHLLPLECLETGGNPEELIAMANKTKKKKKEKDPNAAAAAAAAAANQASGTPTASASAPGQQQQPGPPQAPQSGPPQPGAPGEQPQGMPPPQGYPHGPPPGQPGPSYAVDANGQPIPYGSHPSAGYPYGVPPPPHQGWGAPPPMPHGYYQQPRYPMMMPPQQPGQPPQQQPPMQLPPQQHPGAPPPQAAPHQPPRPNEQQQQAYEEHQRQLLQAQQQRPASTAAPSVPTPQPPCSTAPGTSEQAASTSLQAPSHSAATSRAPSTAPPQSQPPPSQTTPAAPPQTSTAPSAGGPEAGNSSMLANQLGQPPPMGMYPPQHPMGMYGHQRMPYPQGPGGYPPPPGSEGAASHPSMYPPQPGMPSQMYGPQPGMQPPQGWPQGMMRYPQPGVPPQPQQPTTAAGGPGGVPQPGQPSADFWQQQQRAMAAQQQQQAAAAQAQQQQAHGGIPRRPGYFPPGQQASPQPNSSRLPAQGTPAQAPQPNNAAVGGKMMPPPQQPPPAIPGHSRQMLPGPSMQQQQMLQQQQSLQQSLFQMQPPMPFPANSVEAIAQQHLGQQRRPLKKFTKDLINATPRRILMALKSNMHMEIIWALNALTVMLYDDHINPPTLSAEFLNIIIEHFRASLSLVFPKVFPLDEAKTSEDSSEASQSTSEDFWTKIVDESKANGEVQKTKIKLPPSMRNSLGKDLNLVSRLGLKVIVKDAEMPMKLKEWKPTNNSVGDEKENTEKDEPEMTYEEQRKLGLPTEIAFKVATCMKDFVEQQATKSKKVKYSKWLPETKHYEYDEGVQPKDVRTYEEFDELNENSYDHDSSLDCSLVPKPLTLHLISDTIQSYTQLCLAWSNVIRGFAFNPLNEQFLVNHNGLLRLIGRILMLYVEDGGPPREKSRRRQREDDEKAGISWKDLKERTDEEDKAMRAIEEKKRAAAVSNEKDDTRAFLLDVANQLRDDAFTVLSFMSGSLDLFDLDSSISYPIFDALIHWTVSHAALARDPLVPWGAIAPRDFCLEIIAKMSVIDRNVDLLLSTGPWRRIEEFCRVVCDLLHLGEEIPIREFALVILNALCQASEGVCIVAALEGNVVKNILSWMEYIDSKMYDSVSAGSMNELRNNPESVIGTTIGMLRRAAWLLSHIVQHESCRKPFLKHMNNFVNLTISHYMDTRAAMMIASIVYTAQLSNIDSASGKCLDVPDTPSVEPDILFPHKIIPSKKNDGTPPKKPDEPPPSNAVNGVKNSQDDSQPSTSNESTTESSMNGMNQLNGIHLNGTHDTPTKKRINGAHKDKLKVDPPPMSPPKQDVKAILRYSINHKQEAAGPQAKKPRLEVNGTNGLMPNRINGTSPSGSSTTTTSTNSAIVT